jgi:hypothetical protein
MCSDKVIVQITFFKNLHRIWINDKINSTNRCINSMETTGSCNILVLSTVKGSNTTDKSWGRWCCYQTESPWQDTLAESKQPPWVLHNPRNGKPRTCKINVAASTSLEDMPWRQASNSVRTDEIVGVFLACTYSGCSLPRRGRNDAALKILDHTRAC